MQKSHRNVKCVYIFNFFVKIRISNGLPKKFRVQDRLVYEIRTNGRYVIIINNCGWLDRERNWRGTVFKTRILSIFFSPLNHGFMKSVGFKNHYLTQMQCSDDSRQPLQSIPIKYEWHDCSNHTVNVRGWIQKLTQINYNLMNNKIYIYIFFLCL